MAQNISDYQLKFKTLVIGSGTNFGIRAIRGLYDVDIESGATPIPRGDGDIPGTDYVRSKSIEIELVVEGEKQSQALADDIGLVRTAFQRDTDPSKLWFKKPGEDEQFVLARPVGRAIQEDTQSEHGLKPITLRLHAADPRLYSSDPKVNNLTIHESASSGTDFDFNFPQNFTLNQATSFIVENEGNAKAYPVIRFFGPTDAGTIDGVTIFNETTGESLEVQASITSGQILKADMLAYIRASGDQVIGIDGSSRYGDWQVPREPLYLQPGDNLLRYEVDGTTDESVASVTWYDTSL